jgi:cytochrome c1
MRNKLKLNIKTKRSVIIAIKVLLVYIFLTACGGNEEENKTISKTKPKSMLANKSESVSPLDDKGIGPINEIQLGTIDTELVNEGKLAYEAKCTACHKVDKKYIGPSPAGILKRRSPEWVMNMILNPEEMVKKNEIAKKLFTEYNFLPMANQSLTEKEARAILEYFRTL